MKEQDFITSFIFKKRKLPVHLIHTLLSGRLLSSLLTRYVVLTLALTALSISYSLGTHLRAGQITVVPDPTGGPRDFIIRLEIWTNTLNTSVQVGGDQDILDFGDGTFILIPEAGPGLGTGPNGPLPANVHYVGLEIKHRFPAAGFYKISYREPNRNEGVLNMDASVNTNFYLETQIIIDPSFERPNTSPALRIDPIDRGCTGVAFFHNAGAYDLDGDSLSYELVVPFSNRNTTVINYRDPNNNSFYNNPAQGNELKDGFPTFEINEVTGTITWDAPGRVGEYNIAFHVVEHKKVNGRWRRIGYVRRDMQIIVEDCDNMRPKLELPPDLCVVAGTTVNEIIKGSDEDGDPVKIEAFSEVFERFTPPATYTPKPGFDDFVQNAQTTFNWQTTCAAVRDQPYSVVFKITDRPPRGPRLATFETWFITVVGPKPVWATAVPNDASRSVNLTWEPYTCNNAVSMQVWRKVDGSDFQPTECDTGMPGYLGYELVNTVDITDGTTSYVDNNGGAGLEIGPRYCYRLVAVFPPGTRSESLVSDDICIDPFPILTPVITNVDVAITDDDAGEIIVKWEPPKDLDPMPANLSYEVWQAEGFTGGTQVRVDSGSFLMTTVQNLNTEGAVYNYTIKAFAGGLPIGTSSTASSVRLRTQSRNKRIELSWTAEVPWSNTIGNLRHVIYRGDANATTINDLEKIDEVDVTTEGFSYIDRGQWNNVPLEDKEYCYLVETYGSYGNPDIDTDPLINRSQVVCAEPGDLDPPCKPTTPALVTPRDCDPNALSTDDCAGGNAFVNKISWTPDNTECGDDIDFYVIYRSNSIDGDFDPYDTVYVGNEYEDTRLYNSYAKCYKVSAVDRSNNESELSEAFCVDNCPYYELPNVFTPNNDGCNDVFRAYNDKYTSGEESSTSDICTSIPIESARKCARFVERVEFHVYNRWGREVFTYTGENSGAGDRNEDAILINWDGRSNENQELASGLYYYVADVTFISIYPDRRNKTLKGWIHLIREAKTN
jgi:hypothetical protein